MTWYAESRGWILKQKLEHPELNREELRKYCSQNYPFGERRNYPYKAWLQAMRDHFGSARKPKPTTAQNEIANL